jgi:hypothetical protein
MDAGDGPAGGWVSSLDPPPHSNGKPGDDRSHLGQLGVGLLLVTLVNHGTTTDRVARRQRNCEDPVDGIAGRGRTTGPIELVSHPCYYRMKEHGDRGSDARILPPVVGRHGTAPGVRPHQRPDRDLGALHIPERARSEPAGASLSASRTTVELLGWVIHDLAPLRTIHTFGAALGWRFDRRPVLPCDSCEKGLKSAALMPFDPIPAIALRTIVELWIQSSRLSASHPFSRSKRSGMRAG